MARIEHYDKRVGITYVYESESYYDNEKHQSRSKRKLIGKIDPETGEMVSTGKKGRPSKNTTLKEGENNYQKLYEGSLKEIRKKEAHVFELEEKLREKDTSLQNYRSIVQKISNLCSALE
jgi:hypothetical protein